MKSNNLWVFQLLRRYYRLILVPQVQNQHTAHQNQRTYPNDGRTQIKTKAAACVAVEHTRSGKRSWPAVSHLTKQRQQQQSVSKRERGSANEVCSKDEAAIYRTEATQSVAREREIRPCEKLTPTVAWWQHLFHWPRAIGLTSWLVVT